MALAFKFIYRNFQNYANLGFQSCLLEFGFSLAKAKTNYYYYPGAYPGFYKGYAQIWKVSILLVFSKTLNQKYNFFHEHIVASHALWCNLLNAVLLFGWPFFGPCSENRSPIPQRQQSATFPVILHHVLASLKQTKTDGEGGIKNTYFIFFCVIYRLISGLLVLWCWKW